MPSAVPGLLQFATGGDVTVGILRHGQHLPRPAGRTTPAAHLTFGTNTWFERHATPSAARRCSSRREEELRRHTSPRARLPRSGGTNNLGKLTFTSAVTRGSSGSYNLSGSGVLFASDRDRGLLLASGTFTQSGGTNNVGSSGYALPRLQLGFQRHVHPQRLGRCSPQPA